MIRMTLLVCTAAAASTGAITGLFTSEMSAPAAGAATKPVVVALSVAGAPGTQVGSSPMVEVRGWNSEARARHPRHWFCGPAHL
jgi:hypothetical protein